MTLHLATTVEANQFLADDPLGLLIGMLLDQQIPMEKAFTSPQVLAERMGRVRLEAREIAEYDPERFEALFREVPALHRFPAAMAKRTQAMAQGLVERYDGDAAAMWSTRPPRAPSWSSGSRRCPGSDAQKARIFTALLGKQFQVRPRGWREAAGAYGEPGSFRSVADVVDAGSLVKVRAFKQQQKAAAKAEAERATVLTS